MTDRFEARGSATPSGAAESFYRLGLELALSGRYREALDPLRKASTELLGERNVPFRGALEFHRDVAEAIDAGSIDRAQYLCELRLRLFPEDPDTHTHLAHILRCRGRAAAAVSVLDRALTIDDRHGAAKRVRTELGVRKRPVFPFLDRGNAINVYAGKLRHRLRG